MPEFCLTLCTCNPSPLYLLHSLGKTQSSFQTFLRARKRSCYFQMLLFFCPSVTWLAFYICNTQKLGLLFKRHRERERERERGKERENVKWKSAIAVIYQSGVRPQQRTSKWECHGNVRHSLSGTEPLPTTRLPSTKHLAMGTT